VAASLGVNQSTISRRLERGIDALRGKLSGNLLATTLTAMIVEHTAAPRAPATVMQSLGKMAAAGPGHTATAVGGTTILKPVALVVLILAMVAGVVFFANKAWQRSPAAPGISSTQGTPMTKTNSVHSVKREGGRVWIDGVPRLEWGKSGETTFCGALSAALAPSDRPRAYETLMGDAALAFRVRWFRPDAGAKWAGSAPIGEQQEERDRIFAMLGIPFESKWSNPKQMLDRIVQSIDAARPVLAYLSPHKDVAVVYGYADGGQTVLVRDYYDQSDIETAHPITQLGAFFIFMNEAASAPMASRDACIAACRAAVQNWHRSDHPRFDDDGSYAYGDEAYAQWIDDIRSSDAMKPDRRAQCFDVSKWNLNCLNDAHWAAAKYLRANAPLFDAESRFTLEKAASLYERFGQVTGNPTWGEKSVFLGPWSGKSIADWTPEVQQREIQILSDVRTMDRTAIALLTKVATQDRPFAAEVDPSFSAFYEALKRGDDPACESLLKEHPDLARQVDWHTSPGVTALHWACWFDRVRVIDLLLDAGADPNVLDSDHLVTPMEWAHFHGKPAALKRMEERGAHIDLRMAARFDRIDLVRKLLLVPGIDKNAIGTDDYEGSVCLAVLNNNPEILKLLLDAGADARAVNAGLETPLHQAATAGNLECARLLLDHSADPDATNLAGQTPLKLAIDAEHEQLADLLRQHHAKE
jgi:ankyrin repeat protein